ncbi:MAG TPA: oligosaccharide flippase family protein [Bacillota bacterium]
MKSKKLSLKENSIWNISGSVINALSQWALLISIAKIGNSEMVGVFTLGLAITAPIVLLLRFHLRNAVATDSINEYTFNEYFTARTISTIVFIIVMFVITLVYPVKLETSLVIFIISLAKSCESLSDIFHGQWQRLERLDLVAKSRIIKGVSSLIIFSLILFFTGKLIWGTVGLLLVWFLVLYFYDYRITNQFMNINIVFNKKRQLTLLKLTLPLGVAQLIASLNANVPRYFIEYYHGLDQLGIFAGMIYIITAGVNIIIAVEGAIIHQLSIWFQRNEMKAFIRLLTFLMVGVVAGSVLAIIIIHLFGEAILTLIYNEEYANYQQEFMILFIAGIFMYLNKFLETGLTATRKFIVQPYINGIMLLLTILFSFIFIPRYGVIGVGYALIIIGILQLCIRIMILGLIIKRKHRV